MVESRNYVPEWYAKSRDFQVFLKMVDLVVNAAKADIDYFTSLISPDQCKAAMLPLLSNYVGKNYWYDEKVRFNRIIIKNWAHLKQYRGCYTGISMAVSLAINQLEDLDDAQIFKLFNVDLIKEEDDYGRQVSKIRIYLYYKAYLSKLYELIEAVRPAGTVIEIIPAVSINSQETISLTDEYRMLGYDYCTGKLLKIGDIEIAVENCWQIMKNGQPTGEYLVDGEFRNSNNEPTGYHIDPRNQVIVDSSDKSTGKIIRAPYIYKINEDGTETRTGEYFNLNHAARVLNSAYEIRSGGNSNGYYIMADTWVITDNQKQLILYRLKDYMLGNKLVKKVFRIFDDVECNWHIDLQTGYFVKDDVGHELDPTIEQLPWNENCYISKKRYVINQTPPPNEVFFTTQYFVNEFEDIQDNAGNIILSQRDRYKVSDSTSVGFSEVHNMDRCTTYDKTWINARKHSYSWDKDYYERANQTDYNDYNGSNVFEDTRIKITLEDLDLDVIEREYDTTNNIGVISSSSGSKVEGTTAIIPIEEVISGIEHNEPKFRINVTLRKDHTVLDVFSELSFTYDTANVGNNKTILVDWKAADNADMFYNFYDLPERLIFTNKGIINKKKLYFTNEPIQFTDKVYDGTTKLSHSADILNNDNI